MRRALLKTNQRLAAAHSGSAAGSTNGTTRASG
jgi:hypothetical protein